MKKYILLIYLFVFFFISCKGPEPSAPYEYNYEPLYTNGFVDFYGSYYFVENRNLNNILSVSLFSDTLHIGKNTNMVGTGQFLFLEDVFIEPSDTILQSGTYVVNKSGQPFTAYPGEIKNVDNQLYTIGARISYFEKNIAKSKVSLITNGTFTVGNVGQVYNIAFNLKTSDSISLKGSFTGTLKHYDKSVINTSKIKWSIRNH